MKKKSYSKPEIRAEKFAPQEFVAVCTSPEVWTAQCCEYRDRGYIFFDYNGNGVIDDEDRVTEGQHGGCHQTHSFPWIPGQGYPGYNAWVLKNTTVNANPRIDFFEERYSNTTLKEEYANDTYLTPALVKRPGEALDSNWLVCYDLATVKHPS